MGMEWVESSQTFEYNIKKHLYSFCAGTMCFYGTLFFLFFEAKSFVEYTEALFLFSTDMMCGVITFFLVIRLDALGEMSKIIKNATTESK